MRSEVIDKDRVLFSKTRGENWSPNLKAWLQGVTGRVPHSVRFEDHAGLADRCWVSFTRGVEP